jgi:hypothetical protein
LAFLLELLALRHQLVVLRRTVQRPLIAKPESLFTRRSDHYGIASRFQRFFGRSSNVFLVIDNQNQCAFAFAKK